MLIRYVLSLYLRASQCRRSRLTAGTLLGSVFAGIFFPLTLHAGCSPYIGQATLNEYYHNNQSPNKASEYFIETKLLDKGINASIYKNWSLLVCSQYGPDNSYDKKTGTYTLSRCITGSSSIAAAYSDTTLESGLTLADASGGQSWKVLDQGDFPAGYVDNNSGTGHGMEVFLLDENDLIVDFTSVAGYSVHAGDLGAGSCSYLYDNAYSGSNTFSMQRLPDGTGCWPEATTQTSDTTANGTPISCLGAAPEPGSSGSPTAETPNTDELTAGIYPYLIIDNLNVAPGASATFTVSIAGLMTVTKSGGNYTYAYDATTTTFTSDVIFDYRSADGTATSADGDYNSVALSSATIPAGAVSTTVTITTNSTASVGEYFYAIISENAADTSDALIIDNNGIATFAAPTVDHLAITTSTASASTCSALAVTIQAFDASNALVTDYAGTVQLSGSSNHGNWSVLPSSGTNPDAPTNSLVPTPDTDDDGSVSYTFSSTGDGGSVTLYFLNQHADSAVTLTATDTATFLTASTGPVAFLDNTFVITPTTATAGMANSATLIAGRPHTFDIVLWTKDVATGLCAIADGYNSAAQGLKAYIDRGGELSAAADPSLDDATATDKTINETIPGTDNIRLDFSAGGSAGFVLNTSDVGRYTLYLTDDSNRFAEGTSLSGSIDLAVQPFGFALDFSGQRKADLGDNTALDNSTGTDTSYAADASGSAFITSGTDFNLTVDAVLWSSGDDTDNDGLPDTSANLYDNATTPGFGAETTSGSGAFTAELVSPVGGRTGTLSATTPVAGGAGSDFSAGSATAMLNWNEVGILDVTLSMSGYLGSSIPITGTLPNLGRFIPASYAVITTDGAYANVHTSGGTDFTYVGESFGYSTEPYLSVYPLNISQTIWCSGTAYPVGDYLLSSDGNGRVYRVISAGSSGSTEPTWPSTTGATVSSSGVTYQDVGPLSDYVTYNVTANSGEFSKLTGADLTTTLAAVDTTSGLSTAGSEGLFSGPDDNIDGSLGFSLGGAAISLDHNALPIASFSPTIDITLDPFSDADGISFSDGTILSPSGNLQRYGRAVLSDTYGNSTAGSTLAMPLALQYYDGSGFIDNDDDADTVFNAVTWLACTDPDAADNLSCADVLVSNTDVGHGESFTLTACGRRGTLVYTLDLSTVAPYLQYDWAGSNTLSNPSASATFGIYRGDDRFLFWREVE